MRRFKFCNVLFLILALASPAVAAELSGQILYANGRPAGGVPYTIEGTTNSGVPVKIDNLNTDGAGRYSVQLEPGNYTLGIENESFGVHVFPERTQRNFKLQR